MRKDADVLPQVVSASSRIVDAAGQVARHDHVRLAAWSRATIMFGSRPGRVL
ncbi:hypothetical protein [Nonomuraea cavernae]|uniref:hypothetical protein n=1 Tax=Nonomuraea cavernae TaxID=2045107 RepID=UPI0033DE627E